MSLQVRALSNRYLDFWLLGGASIILWAAFVIGAYFRESSWAFNQHFNNAAAVSVSLAVLVNHPHFMASYKFGYGRGAGYILKYWFQLILVPLLLVAGFAYSYMTFETSIQGSESFVYINSLITTLGFDLKLGAGASLGSEILGYMVYVMFMTVGWHYAKQTYGCMMVYASFDKYPLSHFQRNLIRINLFGVWWLNFFSANTVYGQKDYFGLKFYSIDFPKLFVVMSGLFVLVSFFAIVYYVLIENYDKHKIKPSLNFLVPFVALYIWWVPLLIQPDFFANAVPFFHSLQYLAFVFKMESLSLQEKTPETKHLRGTIIMMGLIIAGFLSFSLVPNSLDAWLKTNDLMKAWFFFICFNVFINVHHYFIDNVIWRFDNADVKSYLLK